MKKLLVFILIVGGFVLVAGMWYVKTRNHLVTLDEQVKESWSQVENVYQRRLDLIPNLVATVKGYAAHERETLEAVVQARAQASSLSKEAMASVINDPQAFERFQQAQGVLSSALTRLLAVVERYPDLKANQNFLELQAQLEGTENRITVERRRFNEVARTYNTEIRRFPASLVASFSGFAARPYFQADPGASRAPTVDFSKPAVPSAAP